MQYSAFYPEELRKRILKNFPTKDFPNNHHSMGLLMYVQLPELSGPIEKLFSCRIRKDNNEYKTYVINDNLIVDKNKNKFIQKLIGEIIKIKPCNICTKLINTNDDLCYRCEIRSISNLSIFQQICGICQDNILQNAKIMKCCGKLIHINCYKIYKYKKLREEGHMCEDCCDNMISCPYCRSDHHCC